MWLITWILIQRLLNILILSMTKILLYWCWFLKIICFVSLNWSIISLKTFSTIYYSWIWLSGFFNAIFIKITLILILLNIKKGFLYLNLFIWFVCLRSWIIWYLFIIILKFTSLIYLRSLLIICSWSLLNKILFLLIQI